MQPNKVISEEEWLAARKALLVKEKALSKARDRLNADRRDLPWAKVEKNYLFDGPNGRETLADLFAGRSQLIVYHFMFAAGVAGWPSAGCPMCSFLSDHIDATLPHLEHHDVSLVVVSQAPQVNLESYRRRMGWRFKWLSSDGNGFGRDYRVSFTDEDIASGNTMYNYETGGKTHAGEAPGISVFFKDEHGDIFHTYSSYARGGDLMIGTYNYLDLTPKGRNEKGENEGWVRRHDEYP
jgi:predicted dithiol-disulfide oxidoreductase (DUF899 family)